MKNQRTALKLILAVLSACLLLSSCGKEAVNDADTERTPMQVGDPDRYLKPIFEVQAEKDFVYGQAKNSKGQMEKLLLDVYQPAGDTEKSRPAIIWIHGGGYTSGSKEGGIEKELAVEFAKRGYVTFNINYRLREVPSDDWIGTFIDATGDAANALKWVLKNSGKYRVDKNYVAFAGHSAGGNISINLCYREELKEARWDKKSVFSVIDLEGGETYMGSVHKSDPPCIIIHGTKDDVVPISESISFSQKLERAGVPYQLYTIEGATHSLWIHMNEVTDATAKFLYKNLTGKEADMPIRTYTEISYEKEYRAKQMEIKVDGRLDEWEGAERIPFDQIKDAGKELPSKTDFFAEAMVGWNAKDAGRIYVACKVEDDMLQDIHPHDNAYWEDDCIEILFDLSDDIAKKRVQAISFVLGANGTDLSDWATSGNTEWKVVREGDSYIYEAALNVTQVSVEAFKSFAAKEGGSIGCSISADDCENGVREHQIGWISGNMWNGKVLGRIVFDPAFLREGS